MTKAEAVAEFRETILPSIRSLFGKNDAEMAGKAWDKWLIRLQKDGRITVEQCDKWANPFYKAENRRLS